MKRLFTFCICFLSTIALSQNTIQKTLEYDLTKMISIIQNHFLEGQEFKVFNTYTVEPKLIINKEDHGSPNAVLYALDESTLQIGIEVNRALLRIQDRHAIQFALAHELGHAFSEKLLQDINCVGVNGQASEVVADLGAVYVLLQMGLSSTEIKHTISNWRQSGIFNEVISGDHPAGEQRAQFIFHALNNMQNGETFQDTVNHIIRNILDSKC